MKSRMIREARDCERRALALERPEAGCCADPTGAAALYRIAALIYSYTGASGATAAGADASRAADLKATQAEAFEVERRAAEPQAELF